MSDSASSPGGRPVRPPSARTRIRRLLFGPPRDLKDSGVFRHISVVAFLAWVGLGADGLSSSAYGPEEAFRSLGGHTYLAVALAVLMMATVFIISACYGRIIERFPQGGGGYHVASALLGKPAGVVSGTALLVDYVLTITISIAAAGDALFSVMPPAWASVKLGVESLLILILVVLNIRGVKESILALLPVFLLFLATHAILIGGGLAAHAGELPATLREMRSGWETGLSTLGAGGLIVLFFHAYSLGGATYTGIEAVSNGVPIMREPRVRTARRTMLYMAVSLAATASGLLVCYLLWKVAPVEGRTLNAVLAERVGSALGLGGTFMLLTLVSEGALLVVAAQAGFLDGPRVLANMANDSWVPRRFSSLSERLTTRNGIVIMGVAALCALLLTRGSVRYLAVMYSINVFLTFSISMLGMTREILRTRRSGVPWKGACALFSTGLLLCVTILGVTVVEKFREGGWITLGVTAVLVAVCFHIRRHYRRTSDMLTRLSADLKDLPRTAEAPPPLDATKPTAVVLVGAFGGLGVHTLLAIFRAFPGHFRNVVFVSVGVVDSALLKSEMDVAELRARTDGMVRRYVDLAHGQGIAAAGRTSIGTDIVEELERLCLETARQFPQAVFFAGQLVFQRERWYQPLLHNDTAFAVQKRLQWAGLTMVILPARVGA